MSTSTDAFQPPPKRVRSFAKPAASEAERIGRCQAATGCNINAVLAAHCRGRARTGRRNIDRILVDPAVTARTRAILCVHQLGMPCDLARLLPITDQLGLPLIEDAACAAGSEINLGQGWERIGRPHGLAACFSFHPRKVLQPAKAA
jgi:hypothetical protein